MSISLGYNTIKDTEIDYRKPIIEPPKEKPIVSPFMTGSESTTSIRAEKSSLYEEINFYVFLYRKKR